MIFEYFLMYQLEIFYVFSFSFLYSSFESKHSKYSEDLKTDLLFYFVFTWQPCSQVLSSAHSFWSMQNRPDWSSLNPLGQIHRKLPRVLTQVPGLGQVPGWSHSFISRETSEWNDRRWKQLLLTSGSCNIVRTVTGITVLRVTFLTAASVTALSVDAILLAQVISGRAFVQISATHAIGI